MNLFSLFRKICGNSFPRLGRKALEVTCWVADGSEYEVFPGINLRLNGKDDVHKAVFWSGTRFEYPTAHVLKAWAHGGASHFFDIGSNIGFFSYWIKTEAPQVEIHAFEPNPNTFNYISQACSKNGIKKMHCHQMGLSDQEDFLDLHPGVEDSGHSTFGNHPGLKTEAIRKVPVKPFDQWRKAQGLSLPDRPSWIGKIDVEGFEANVLRGMKEALESHSFIGLAVEMNSFTLEFCGSSLKEIEDILLSSGYVRMPSHSQFGSWSLDDNVNSFWIPRELVVP